MPTNSHDHLATITPVHPRFAGRALGALNLFFYTISIIIFSSGWCLMTLVGLYTSMASSLSPAVGTGIVLLSFVWLGIVITLVFTYPEWPHNRGLCSRLRRAVEIRTAVSLSTSSIRVVELVPRERWNRVRLETATDLMTLEVDEQGVRMKGDRFDYEVPRESILGAQVESITPTGWLCRSHMVVLFVRTAEGTVELPIAYRDFEFGSLRISRRKQQTIALADKLTRIADCEPYRTPTAATAAGTRAPVWSRNPYAAPVALDES